MKRFLSAALLWLLAATAAIGQQNGVPYFPQILPPNTVVGRLGQGAGPTEAIPFLNFGQAIGVNFGVPGAKCDDITDDTAAFQAAINNAQIGTTNTINLPSGTCLILGQLTFPNNGGSPVSLQPTIRLMGQGMSASGRGSAPNRGTILDVRYAGVDGKITTFGDGYLEIANLTMVENGSTTTTPFIYGTNTVLNIHDVEFFGFSGKNGTACNQDAIVLGGTGGTVGMLDSSLFQGYGTRIVGNYANRVQRFAYLRAGVNSIVVRDNEVWINSGSGLAGGAAIEVDGTPTSSDGNLIEGNLIEVANYVYGIKITNGVKQQLMFNSMWDETGTTSAYYRFESGTVYNTVIHGHGKTSGIALYSDGNTPPSTNSIISNRSGDVSYWAQPWTFNTTLIENGNFQANAAFVNTTTQSPVVVGGGAVGSSLSLESTSAAGTTDFIRFLTGTQNEFGRILTFNGSVNNGQLIIGNTASVDSATGSLPAIFQIHGTTGGGSAMSLFRWSNDTATPQYNLIKSRSTTIGTHGAVTSGDTVAFFQFKGDDGTNFITAAQISAVIEGTVGTNNMPARLAFSTAATTGTAQHEVLRLDHNQHVKYSSVATPSLAAVGCLAGNSAAIVAGSTDTNGQVGVGGTATTSCGITFAQAYTTAPFCTATTDAASGIAISAVVTTGGITFNFASSSGFHVAWTCYGT